MRHSCAVLALTVSLGGMLQNSPATANGDRLYLDCPCTIESDGSTLNITAGVRSFRSIDSGALVLRAEPVRSRAREWEVFVTPSLAGGSTLESASYSVALGDRVEEADPVDIELVLYEEVNHSPVERDRVRMEDRVDLTGAFSVADLDFLKDTDGDGVGDINEGLEGTDPLDAGSTPGPSTIDLLAFFDQAYSLHYDGDATTRIQHVVALANDMFRISGAQLRLRLVGIVDRSDADAVALGLDRVQMVADRHGADLMASFTRPYTIWCGRASIGGMDRRGLLDFERERHNSAVVYAGCGASTLAHELGHVMGLGHSLFQNSVGTWRWSRGHLVDRDFGTIMTYGRSLSPDVFSNPQTRCVGGLEEEKPCGVDGDEVNGADAVTTLNAVRFQVARFREALPDTDEDGFVDPVDLFPDDAGDWWDADGDGAGDNADTDDDNDGVADGDDAFPFDATETADTDADGVGDNADAFPQDPEEAMDSDGDGVGDNADVFPGDPLEWLDADGDGVGDNGDLWPANPDEHADTDGDGIGDRADPDADNDGVADDLDPHPLDAARSDLASYLFTGEFAGDQAGEILSRAGGGDAASFLIGVPLHDGGGQANAGAVYLVSASDIGALDAADGRLDRAIGLGHVASGADSWKFIGEHAGDEAGRGLASSGDMDGDGLADLLIGAPFHAEETGAVYYVSGADFAAADAADGIADGTIHLGHVAPRPGSWKFVGEDERDEAGIGVAPVPDTDGDGKAELLIGAWEHGAGEREGAGATYLVASGDVSSADAADGASDGVIGLGRAAGQSSSWKLIGESSYSSAGGPVAAPGDIDGDGNVDIAIHSQYLRVPERSGSGAVYLVSLSDLAGADAADGLADRVVDLGRVVAQPKSWMLHSGAGLGWARRPLSIADDGIGPTRWLTLARNMLSSSELAPTDAADGAVDGVVDLQRLSGSPNSWEFDQIAPVGDIDGDGGENFLVMRRSVSWPRYHFWFLSFAGAEARPGGETGAVHAGDLGDTPGVRTIVGGWPFTPMQAIAAGDTDGDGLSDILLGDPGRAEDNRPGTVYLLPGADLRAPERVDIAIDNRLHLGNVAGDTDGDGVLNSLDRDDDGDGIPDGADAFPLDPGEWADTDRDGVGDNADAFPDDRREKFDTDGDGLGDRYADEDDDGDGIADDEDAYPYDTDNDGVDNRHDEDDDGDGVPDIEDALPIDPAEFRDTDGDGLGNNADTDDDNDGVADGLDSFPLDPAETLDTDGDGVGDNADAFPSDPSETHDADGDGIGDNADTDDDNDGIPDVEDGYPLDPGASADTDGDGVADARDAFPGDAGEWDDTDGDGIGDNADSDDDNDGVGDASDLFPLDASRWDLTSFRLDLGVSGGPWIDVAGAGDLDGDGAPAVLIAAPSAEARKVVLVVEPGDLAAADGGDGVRDGSAHLRHVLAGLGSWKVVAPHSREIGEFLSSFGDLNGDGFGEFFASTYRGRTGYILSGADLLAADAADGSADGVIDADHVKSQPASWELFSFYPMHAMRTSRPGDLDDDGFPELALGFVRFQKGDSADTVNVIPFGALPILDARTNPVDGKMHLSQYEEETWRLIGEAPGDWAGAGLAMRDLGGDGRSELIVGAPRNGATLLAQGAVYLLDGRDVEPADLADGSPDRFVELARVAEQPNSWKLVVEVSEGNLGHVVAAGDLDGDRREDLVLGSRDPAGRALFNLVSGLPESLPGMDAADGDSDGLINLTGNASVDALRIDEPLSSSNSNFDLTDFDGDGRDDILVAVDNDSRHSSLAAYMVSSSALFDAGDRGTGRLLTLQDAFARGGSFELYVPEADNARSVLTAIAAAGDVDGDGLGDIVLGALPNPFARVTHAGAAAYLIVAADLPALDAADGRSDGRIFLSNVVRTRR